MGTTRVDARFLLPRRARNVLVLGELPDWTEAQVAKELRIFRHSRERGERPDLVVASRECAIEAIGVGAEMAIIEQPSFFRPRSVDATWTSYLSLPSAESPEIYIPLNHPAALRYAFGSWIPSRGRRGALHKLAGISPLSQAARLAGTRSVATVCRLPGQPFAISAAQEFGVPARSQWFLTPGVGDPREKRNVFQIFPPGSRDPALVLKVARFEDQGRLFDEHDRGLDAARKAGAVVAARAPRLVQRFQVEQLPAALEEAVAGERLPSALASSRARHSKLELVNQVCAWLLDIARASRAGAPALRQQRQRLAVDVLPEWARHGAPPDLLDRIVSVPSTFAHNDLSPGNIVAGSSGFKVVDWETARPDGFPLWDLWFFLPTALFYIDRGPDATSNRVDYFAALFRGEEGSSQIVFEWTRRLVHAIRVPEDAVGALATLCWLDYGLWGPAAGIESEVSTSEPAKCTSQQSTAVNTLLARGRLKTRLAERWLRDPALGPDWSRWRREAA